MTTELEAALSRFQSIQDEWWEGFAAAFTEYGPGAADETGLAGQWADLHRKVRKLKRAMWEGDEDYLEREGMREILMDLAGHVFLALELIDRGQVGGRIHSPSPPWSRD
jgi:hypothetical protein